MESIRYQRIYMGHLRDKLEDDPPRPRYLLMETAGGYLLQLPAGGSRYARLLRNFTAVQSADPDLRQVN